MIYTKDSKNNFKASISDAIRHRSVVLNKTQVSLADRMGVCRNTISLAFNWDPGVSMSVFRMCDVYTNAGGRVTLKFVRSNQVFVYNKLDEQTYKELMLDYILNVIQTNRYSIAQAAREGQTLRGMICALKRRECPRGDTLLDIFSSMKGVVEFTFY